MKVMGIDQSYTSSGIVIIDDGEIVLSELIKSPKALDAFDRADYIAKTIVTIANQHQPDCIGIEGLAFGMRGNATRDLAGLQFMIVNAVRENGFDIDVISPKTVKVFATGSGKAKKEDLYKALPEKTQNEFLNLGVKKTTGLYDLTDGYWIAKYTEDKKK